MNLTVSGFPPLWGRAALTAPRDSVSCLTRLWPPDSIPRMLTNRVDGDGPPLLLLNGGMMSISAWQPLLEPLTKRYRVIRCDFRGQLLTPGPFPLTMEEHARDLVELLDELRVERVHVAGVSFGALVGMLLAALHPERVDRLTVMAATDYTEQWMRDDAAASRLIAEGAAAGSGDGGELLRRISGATWSDWWLAQQPPDFLETRMRLVGAQPPAYFEGAAAILRLLETLDLRPYLGRITAPTLVLGGEHDRMFPVEHTRAIAAAIPGARMEIIAGTGHGLLIERAGRVLELLTEPLVVTEPQHES
jgi:pimeloyl-ACP methyl ester carboxylesterase